MRAWRCILGLVCMGLASGVHADTSISVVGDIDNFTGGSAADVLFRSSMVVDLLTVHGYTPFGNADQDLQNSALGYTHSFSVPPGHSVVGATLTVGLRPGAGYLASDFLGLDLGISGMSPWGEESGPRTVIVNLLGSTPPAFTTTPLTLDLSRSGCAPAIWQ